MARPRSLRTESAGGVVYRVVEGQIEVVLCGLLDVGIWGLPKGTPHRGEDRWQTAAREVHEETGLVVRVVAPLGEIEYDFVGRGARYHKTVHYFLMEPIGGDFAQHDPEFDVVRWLALERAYDTMTYDNERAVVRMAEDRIHRRLTEESQDSQDQSG